MCIGSYLKVPFARMTSLYLKLFRAKIKNAWHEANFTYYGTRHFGNARRHRETEHRCGLVTSTTASLAAMASKSAQETVPGHSASSFSLILSTSSNPFSELTFWSACFSPIMVAVSSSSTDPSHPCKNRAEFRCSAGHLCQSAALADTAPGVHGDQK